MPDNSFEVRLTEALRTPAAAIDPQARFAARLRARLGRALTLPKGVDVTSTTPASSERLARMEVTPYLAVAGAREALAWYREVFGAIPTGELIEMPDDEVHHAELDLGGARIMLAEQDAETGFVAPRLGEGTAVTIHLQVPDVDSLAARAVSEGAVLDRSPAANPYGRSAVIRDPFGHRWMLMSPRPARYPGGTRHGDVGYISFEVPDVEQAEAFYGHVLSWTFGPASSGKGRSVLDSMPDTGLWGGQPRGALVICWRVDDLTAAIEAVRRLGGSASEPDARDYGLLSHCTDDQGMRFYLWQPTEAELASGRAVTERPPLNGTRHGDLTYLTLEVVDSERLRELFGALLGWTFAPGRSEDGWNVSDPMPMTGVSGGHETATAVPMWRVDDIAAAVERVIAAGGTSSPVERQPYGLSADCTDNQGTRFGLNQE